MNIGGWQKMSLTDFPDTVSSIIFTNGCVFRCSFCYNSDLIEPPFKKSVDESEIFDFLKQRKGLIDGVVITGGEPTIQPDLRQFIAQVKALGLKVKLDTCGYVPSVVESLLKDKVIDYIAMDIKAPLHRYQELVNIPVDTDKILKSIELIQDSDTPYEFRSTLVAGFHTPEDVMSMVELIEGAPRYYLQRYQPMECVYNPEFRDKQALPTSILQQIAARCREYVGVCEVRG